MQKRDRDMQVFSMSFLDLISCALGGTLLLLLAMEVRSEKKIAQANEERDAAEEKAEGLEEENEQLKQVQKALTGLGGDLENVVYIFDVSGSMQETENSNIIPQKMLDSFCEKVRLLPAKQFNIVTFSDTAEVWKSGKLLERTDSNVDAACAFIQTLRADGRTNTHAALTSAYALPGVDTVILFTDGDPTIASPGNPNATAEQIKEELLEFVDAKGTSTVLNTVNIGEALDANFLIKLAELGGGTNSSL